MWIWLVLLYGLLKGAREVAKKKALTKNTVLEVLLLYTIISFVFVIPTALHTEAVPWKMLLVIAFKSFVIFVAWILSFRVIKKMPVSMYGVLDLSRVVFATVLSIVFLKEEMGPAQMIGLVLVCVGLFLCQRKKNDVAENVSGKLVIFALISCLCNAISGVMDKFITKTVEPSALQFWYMLFLVVYYIIYMLVTKEKIAVGKALKNYWIWILAIMFVIGDRALFIANKDPNSKVVVMTLIKQSCCVVTILAGKLVFKEKNIGYKLICLAIIISGIMISTIF